MDQNGIEPFEFDSAAFISSFIFNQIIQPCHFLFQECVFLIKNSILFDYFGTNWMIKNLLIISERIFSFYVKASFCFVLSCAVVSVKLWIATAIFWVIWFFLRTQYLWFKGVAFLDSWLAFLWKGIWCYDSRGLL